MKNKEHKEKKKVNERGNQKETDKGKEKKE